MNILKRSSKALILTLATFFFAGNISSVTVHPDSNVSPDSYVSPDSNVSPDNNVNPDSNVNTDGKVILEDNIGEVSRVVVSFNGDTKTSKGFTWYTTQVSVNSDLQVIEKTEAKESNFENAMTFEGEYQISTNAPQYVVHQAEASGLKTNTEYQFRVGDASLDLWSDVGSFETSDEDGEFTFINLTDTQAKNELEAELSANTFKIANEIVEDSEFMVLNGDFVDSGLEEDQWGWVLDNADDTLLNTTFVAAAGNHDEDNQSFIEHFNLSTPTGSSTKTGAYYSYDYENVHFVVLNNNEDSEEFRNFTPRQIEWLKTDVTKANADENIDWTIVVMHKGPYTTSNHATDYDIMGLNGVREVIAPLFNELGIDLVLQGHDHIYARTKPIKNGKATGVEKIIQEYDGQQVDYSLNPDGAIYMIPNTAGPKVYYKNTEIDPSFYDLFDVAEEHSAAKYGPDPSDSSRPVRSRIQNFVEFNVNKNMLTGIVYEIDQSLNDGEPYVVDVFGIIKDK